MLNLDATARGPDDKARLDWLRKQFAKLDVQLVVRATDYNRFQEKVRKGNAQIFYWGWNADYPDPENFLFLLHGPQGKVKSQGENASNYVNPEFDRLFERMKNMDNGPERQAIIDQMIEIARRDAPWVWGFHPKDYGLAHAWVKNRKPNQIANNSLKYQRIDAGAARATCGDAWNRPVLWPLGPPGGRRDRLRRAGGHRLPPARARDRPDRRAVDGGEIEPCCATSSAACSTRSRS